MMTWLDSLDIAISLDETYPEIDPQTINFVDLQKLVLALAEFDAGERFRIDFTKAQLSPSLTANWEVQSIGRAKRSHGGGLALDATHKALMARKRFDRAFVAVGAGLQDVLIEVCCHLHGLEGVEKSMHWPQRSGKVVLKIALGRLVQHYEMGGADA